MVFVTRISFPELKFQKMLRKLFKSACRSLSLS